MLGYKVPEPDEAMLISGGKGADGAPFRVVTGHGAFVLPFFRKARFLSLSMAEAEVTEACVSRQGISLNVRAVIAFKVGNDTESIVNAGQRFLSDQSQMSVLVGRIFAGHLRSIVGSMTVEEIVTERQRLAEGSRRLEGGDGQDRPDRRLVPDPVHRRHEARLHRGDGRTAQRGHPARRRRSRRPRPTRPSAEAQQQSDRAQAQYVRETTIVQAQVAAAGRRRPRPRPIRTPPRPTSRPPGPRRSSPADERRPGPVRLRGRDRQGQGRTRRRPRRSRIAAGAGRVQPPDRRRPRPRHKAEVDRAESEASQAGPLAQATAQREVIAAQTELAVRNGDLRQQQLVAEVVKPAEAEAERVRILAQAEAERTRIQAEAAASNNRVSLDQLLIDQLPQIVREAARAWPGANSPSSTAPRASARSPPAWSARV